MLSDNEIIIEIAKLDGWEFSEYGCVLKKDGRGNYYSHLPYLTSRDTIVPVIEKLDNKTWDLFESELWKLCKIECLANKQRFLNDIRRKALLGTPRQLCIALLKATGKWKD